MSATRALLVGVAATLLTLAASAQVDEAAEHARIGRERADAQARFEQRQRECSQRFAVTTCVEEARAQHRQAMIQLRRQEAVLDEAQRRQRAAARLVAIEEKRRAEAQRAASAPATARAAMPMQAKPPRPPASVPAAVARPASAPASSAAAARREQRKRDQFDARQREAQVHREQSERRRADRDAAGKASAPLPDPAAR